MTVDGRSNTGDNALGKAFVFAQGDDGFDVFVSERARRRAGILLSDVIGQKDGGKDRETLGRVERAVVVVRVDTCQFYFVSRFARVT